MVLMTATNLFSVSSFGEFEYWFAGIKVVRDHRRSSCSARCSCSACGPNKDVGLQQPDRARRLPAQRRRRDLLQHRGGDLLDGRRRDRHHRRRRVRTTRTRAIAKATNSVIFRVAIFFVGSIFLLAVILPWNSTTSSATSPYVAAFQAMGIPYADHIMNAVVLTAVLSCLNSGLYTASRMLFVLAARREAPVRLITVNRRGVPAWAILSSTRRRLPLRDRGLRLAGHGLPVPAELLRRGDPVRLPADRGLAVHPAPAHRPDEARGQDVAVPGA